MNSDLNRAYFSSSALKSSLALGLNFDRFYMIAGALTIYFPCNSSFWLVSWVCMQCMCLWMDCSESCTSKTCRFQVFSSAMLKCSQSVLHLFHNYFQCTSHRNTPEIRKIFRMLQEFGWTKVNNLFIFSANFYGEIFFSLVCPEII